MRNIGLKILAVLFSTALWLVVVNFTDPIITDSIPGVKVEILNQDALVEQGKVFEVLDNTDIISVSITAPRSVYDEISADNIHAEADLKEVNYMDAVKINVYTDKNASQINSISANIENLKLNIEDLSNKQLVITPEVSGEPQSGYIQGSVSVDQNIVRISGPESQVSRVVRASVSVNIEGMSSTIHTSAEVKLYDADDKLVENVNIVQNIDDVTVSVEVLEVKEVPIVIDTMGEPGNGYIATGEYALSTETIMVAGRQSTMNSIYSIEIPAEAIDISNRTTDAVFVISLAQYLPSGVVLVNDDNQSLSVTIMIEEAFSEVFYIEQSKIRFINLPTEYTAELTLDGELPIIVTGTKEALESVVEAQISGVIDVQALIGESDVVLSTYEAEIVWNLAEPMFVEVSTPVVLRLEETE